ncbi:sporulation protein YpjB [Ammoniphilus sp. YIM 78166]|uniref:sporulation protein YpjB n=1 Tax=Ammoniphilus sp. YIM 78166 TaxID=1644106 RepID=UPI0010705DAB|nr:sporulation protein YpjB [Ammoniphilus sp. YIM 78166]
MDKKFFLFMITILLMVSTIPMLATAKTAESPQQILLKDLDRLSQEALKLTEEGQFEAAKAKLDELAQRFTQVDLNQSVSLKALELASHSMVKGKLAYANASLDKDEALWHATQIRILIDALTHPHQPIWKGFHMTYLQQISKMIHHSEREEADSLDKSLQEHMKLYLILKPAFAVNHNPSTMDKIDSLYGILQQETHQEKVNWGTVETSLDQLKGLTGNLFLGQEDPTFAWYISSNSPVAMITLIGLILLTVLTYVGWRMYMGQRYSV